MLGVRLAKKYLVQLYANATLTLQLTSLLFRDEPEKGNLVAGFTFPAEGANADFFKNHHTEHSIYSASSFSPVAEIFKDTLKLEEGRWEFSEETDEETGINIYVGIDALPVMQKKLSELNLGGDRTIGSTAQDVIDHAKDQNTHFYPDVEYVFPTVYNSEFYPDDVNQYWYEVINRWDPDAQSFYLNETATGHVENRDTLVPYTFHHYVIKQAFAEEGFEVEGDFMNDPDMQQATIENNFALDEFGDQHYKIFVAGDDPIDELGAGSFVHMPVESGGTYYDDDDAWYAGGDYYTICATGPTEIIFQALFSVSDDATLAVDASIRFDVMVDDGATQIAIASQEYLAGSMSDGGVYAINISLTPDMLVSDLTNHIYVYYTAAGMFHYAGIPTLKITPLGNNASLNEYSKIINLKNHVPDMTTGEYIVALKSTYGLSIEYNYPTKKVALNYVSNKTRGIAKDYTPHADKHYKKLIDKTNSKLPEYIFSESDKASFEVGNPKLDPGTFNLVANYDALPTPVTTGQRYLILDTQAIYESFYNGDTSVYEYKLLGFNFRNVWNADPEAADYIAKCSPVMMRRTLFGADAYPIPNIEQQGSSIAYGMGINNNTELRTMFWRGMCSLHGHDFPYANNSNYSIDGSDTYDLSLDFKGVKGLQVKCWGKWFLWINSGIRWTRRFTFSVLDYINFNLYAPLRCKQNYFIASEVDVTIENKKETIEMDMQLMPMIEVRPITIWQELWLQTGFPNPNSDWIEGVGPDAGTWTFGLPGASHSGSVSAQGTLTQFYLFTVPAGTTLKTRLVISGMTTGEAYIAIGFTHGTHRTADGDYEEDLSNPGDSSGGLIAVTHDFDGVIQLGSVKMEVTVVP
jgi:hypothetical protein